MVRLLVKSHWPPFIFDNCECGGAAIPKQWPCPLHLSLSSSPLTVLFTSHCPLHLSLSSSPLTVLFTSHCPLHLSLSSSPLTVLFTSHCPLHLSLSSSPLTVLFTSHCPLHLSLSSSPLTVLFTSHCPLHLSLSSSPLISFIQMMFSCLCRSLRGVHHRGAGVFSAVTGHDAPVTPVTHVTQVTHVTHVTPRLRAAIHTHQGALYVKQSAPKCIRSDLRTEPINWDE